MKFFTLRLPVKKYIQKYLTTLYGPTIPATMDTDIGFVVLNTMASRIEGKVARGYNKEFSNFKSAIVTFTVPFHYFYLTKKELSIHTCILLNRYFETKFLDELSSFISMRGIKGNGGYCKAIEEFASFYNIEIEEDISFDGLKKKEYRHRNKAIIRERKKNFNNKLRNLSPNTNPQHLKYLLNQHALMTG